MEMKQFKRLMVIIMCISALLSLFGCKNIKDKYILDGPGMVNIPVWKSFSISQSHSCANYNFDFTVSQDEFGDYYVTGTCIDDEGNLYQEENGKPITYETVDKLHALKLDELEDVKENQSEIDDDLFLLDATVVTLNLTYVGGNVVKKAASEDLAFQIYNYLSPYFINQ